MEALAVRGKGEENKYIFPLLNGHDNTCHKAEFFKQNAVSVRRTDLNGSFSYDQIRASAMSSKYGAKKGTELMGVLPDRECQGDYFALFAVSGDDHVRRSEAPRKLSETEKLEITHAINLIKRSPNLEITVEKIIDNYKRKKAAMVHAPSKASGSSSTVKRSARHYNPPMREPNREDIEEQIRLRREGIYEAARHSQNIQSSRYLPKVDEDLMGYDSDVDT